MTSTPVAGVLDLTFLDIKEEADLERVLNERIHLFSGAVTSSGGMMAGSSPASTGFGGLPGSPVGGGGSANFEPMLGNTQGSPTQSTRRRGNSEDIKAIRLANNLLENLSILCGPLSKVLDCSKILWIDISFNHIKNIPEAFIAQFPNITTIYCHANKIAKLSVVKKFSGFAALKSLSLYGNPVEEHKVCLQLSLGGLVVYRLLCSIITTSSSTAVLD
jgi:hypothetical protein